MGDSIKCSTISNDNPAKAVEVIFGFLLHFSMEEPCLFLAVWKVLLLIGATLHLFINVKAKAVIVLDV